MAGTPEDQDRAGSEQDRPREAGHWHEHDLYTDADADRPDVICDRNGQVVLGLCKRCLKGECELAGPCDSLPFNVSTVTN